MNQLREFLRHQYIGAIIVGLLAFQGLVSLVPAILGPVFFMISRTSRSVISPEKADLPWDTILQNLVQAALFLVLAWVLLRWLYAARPEPTEELSEEPAE